MAMIVDPCALLSVLAQEPTEAEWLEFKQSYWDPEQTGRNCSALANSAMLLGKDRAFIVFGVENGTHALVGTSLRLKKKKHGGGENFENWLNRMLRPSLTIEICDFGCGKLKYSIVAIEPSYVAPVKFNGTEYIRIGENTRRLEEYPDRLRALWFKTGSRTFEDVVAVPGVDEAGVTEFLDVDAYFELRRMVKPAQRSVQLAALMGSNLLRDTREGTYDITNLGALLLARDLSRFASLTGKAPRVIRYLGANKMRSQPEKRLLRG